MKIVKRLTGLLLLLILVAIFAAIAIPYFYKDELVEAVKDTINDNIDATVDFSDVSLSIFRSFPDLSFKLNDLSVIGEDEFEGINLANIKGLDFTLDLMSVIKQDLPIEIHSVHLDEPDINIQILNSGKSNYDIYGGSEASSSTETTDFLVQLEKYSTKDGKFTYNDRQSDMYVHLVDLDHEGKGNFTQDVYDIFTVTKVGDITTKVGGVKYINRAKGDLDITLNADMRNMKFTLKENEISVNALKVKADGELEMAGNDIIMDLSFDAPENSFKNFLSLIPAAYTKDYSSVKADGQMKFNGFVKGTYNGDKNQFPAFKINLDIKDGNVKYPDLPMGMDNIFADVTINSPSSDFDKMTIDVPAFKMKLGENPFEANFKLKTPVSDPDVDGKMKGKIDLADFSKAFPMDGVEAMTGIINADVIAKTRMSDMDRGDYENVQMSGDLSVQDINYKAEGMPAILVNNATMDFTPKFVNVSKFNAKVGNSDVEASGKIDNILAYFSPSKTMTGDLKINSNYFDMDEWVSEEATSSTSAAPAPSGESTEVFDRFDFNIDGVVKKIKYDVYSLENTNAKGNITPNKFSIQNFSTKLGKSDFAAKGAITNMWNYIFSNENLGGDIDLTSNYIDLNEFMEDDGSASTASTEDYGPILVPENIDIDVNANIKKLSYTNLELKNIRGKVEVADEKIEAKKVKAKMLGGSIVMDGLYNTVDPAKPAFNMEYAIKEFGFKEAFDKLNSFQQLAPIGKFIEGKFNTTMKLNGLLGKDMMPDLNSLTADGFMQTINGVIQNFKPLEKVGDKLNVKYFKNVKLNNTKNWFEVADGLVKIKDFNYKHQDIDMKIGGQHSLTNDMDYKILARVPRKLIGNNVAGQAAESGLNWLKKEGAKYGVNIDAGEFINIQLSLTGTMLKPKIGVKVLGSEDGQTSIVAAVKEKATEVITTKVNEVKDSVKTVVKEKKEDFKKKADAEIAKIMSDAQKQVTRVKDAARKAGDAARKAGYAQADKLVTAAGGNPLKKQAAKLAANKLKKETDKKVDKILAEADKKADGIMDKARQKSEGVRRKYKDK